MPPTISRVVLIAASLATAFKADAAASPDSRPASVALPFSASDRIDLSAFATRDMARPFYFPIHGSSGFGSVPFTADTGSTFAVWLDTRVPERAGSSPSQRSLGFSLWSDQDLNAKDKIFLNPVRQFSPDPMSVDAPDNERFLSFDFMLDKDYQVPRSWVIHLQVLQCCAGHPPFTLRVLPDKSDDKKVAMALAIANDESETAAFGKPVQIAAFAIERNRWIHVVLDLKPSPCSRSRLGKVVGWIDRVQIVDWRGCWGYQLSPASPSERGMVNRNMGIDLGIYRRRQSTKQTIYFDNFKYRTSLPDIDF